jgi:hypothetical protein
MAIGMVQRFYEFGRFRLDGTGRVLFRGDQAVPYRMRCVCLRTYSHGLVIGMSQPQRI